MNLYEKYAAGLPIIDWHDHLSPADLASDRRWRSMTELWIASDPYKHRAMRLAGFPEAVITGSASDEEKFQAWAQTLPLLVGNPLYEWSELELKRVFGIDVLPGPDNWKEIMQECDALLAKDDYSTLGIMRRWNVDTLCTSDDLMADLSVHAAATSKAGSFRVLPSLRGDNIVSMEPALLEKLGNPSNLKEYLAAVSRRLDAFDAAGCRLSDHALDNGFRYDPESVPGRILGFLVREYARRGWVMQLHIGAERHTSTRLRRLTGPAGGYASMGTGCDIASIVNLLDSADCSGLLPKTILYTLNPCDTEALATLMGSFSEDGVCTKIQFGPAWWFNDHRDGMIRQLAAVMDYSLLGAFIGMTTDSRSILSFSRHEYFRCVLCTWLEGKAGRGEVPTDESLLGETVKNISYYNAKDWIFVPSCSL